MKKDNICFFHMEKLDFLVKYVFDGCSQCLFISCFFAMVDSLLYITTPHPFLKSLLDVLSYLAVRQLENYGNYLMDLSLIYGDN